ncbi:LacI family DNA-binding transcriptional regulator [Frigoribacterium sp. 2-23]|uniref:LacI family DNA-binding transcriptional regulator n=1 Tax=Frigoribacterium sp. 2-23 TaxID=3415006 RepID=UPI003C6F27BD
MTRDLDAAAAPPDESTAESAAESTHETPDATPGEAPAPPRRRAGSAPTIYDVAKLAGVAPSTVSRALGKPGRITPRTQMKVQAAADELQYRFNPMARALPTGRSSTLGMLVADFTNPVFFEMVRGAEHLAADHGYTLILSESEESGPREAEQAARLLPSVGGLVLATTRLTDDEILSLAAAKPVVLINRAVPGVDSVVSDVAPGIDAALELLHDLGHRSIAYLAGPELAWIGRRRWDHLLAAAPALGMRIVEIPTSSPTIEGGADALTRVRASGVTAVVAYNDLVAIGLMQAAKEAGVGVPDELSIVGFDDIFGASLTSPSLTTVKTELRSIGARAMGKLLDALGPDDGRPMSVDEGPVPTVLVRRESTGPAAR